MSYKRCNHTNGKGSYCLADGNTPHTVHFDTKLTRRVYGAGSIHGTRVFWHDDKSRATKAEYYAQGSQPKVEG